MSRCLPGAEEEQQRGIAFVRFGNLKRGMFKELQESQGVGAHVHISGPEAQAVMESQTVHRWGLNL